ncbi:type II toxin-antitoxin system HigA family antitoxin [Chamaesiphon sp.]|uniref:helix-turn-helix domain-containing protein n=1 Tax=Chamaesiphon sp. TaxID=2814140 RepID=UPI003592F4CE
MVKSTSEYQPRLIKTEAENERALAIVEYLMNSIDLSSEQEEICDLLVILIERFEQEFYKPDRSKNSGSMLSFLMDQRDFKPIDLVPIFDSETAVEKAIAGRAHIDRATADRLAELFHVDASLF